MEAKHTEKKPPGSYELALLLADGQSKNSEFQWESFIDNLARICDEFAHHTPSKEKPWHPSLQPNYRYTCRI